MLPDDARACRVNEVETVDDDEGEETVTVTAEAVVIKKRNNKPVLKVRMLISAIGFGRFERKSSCARWPAE